MSNMKIRPIIPSDDPKIAAIIRSNLEEFHLDIPLSVCLRAVGVGTSRNSQVGAHLLSYCIYPQRCLLPISDKYSRFWADGKSLHFSTMCRGCFFHTI